MSYLRIALLFLYVISINVVNASALPTGFVYLSDLAPTIVLDMRYANSDNFIGKPIEGYIKPVSIATKEVAVALNNVQTDLLEIGSLISEQLANIWRSLTLYLGYSDLALTILTI